MVVLLQHDQSILEVPEGALSSHHEAGVLGAPLDAGKMMYLDLQNMYKQSDKLNEPMCWFSFHVCIIPNILFKDFI